MIKCEAIQDFSLENFDELHNIERRTTGRKGFIYIGDRFECSEEMAKYLLGGNKDGVTVVKVKEVNIERN